VDTKALISQESKLFSSDNNSSLSNSNPDLSSDNNGYLSEDKQGHLCINKYKQQLDLIYKRASLRSGKEVGLFTIKAFKNLYNKTELLTIA
jgi:hypothetical protein